MSTVHVNEARRFYCINWHTLIFFIAMFVLMRSVWENFIGKRYHSPSRPFYGLYPWYYDY